MITNYFLPKYFWSEIALIGVSSVIFRLELEALDLPSDVFIMRKASLEWGVSCSYRTPKQTRTKHLRMAKVGKTCARSLNDRTKLIGRFSPVVFLEIPSSHTLEVFFVCISVVIPERLVIFHQRTGKSHSYDQYS